MKQRSMKEQYKISQFYKEKAKKEIRTKFYQTKRKEAPIHRILDNLCKRTYVALKDIKLSLKYIELLGCSPDEYEAYLKSLFREDMSFDNYGNWEIDHIIPVSSFDLSNENELRKCFNYNNTQPLWKNENRSKSNKIVLPLNATARS